MAWKTMAPALALMAGLGIAATAALAADNGPAPTTPGGKAVVARQAHYRELNGAFKSVNDELKKDPPDKASIVADASKMKTLADDLPGWSPKGSGPEAGVKTQAKAEIWTDAAGFAAAVAVFQAETAKLQDAAAAGDPDAIRTQARAIAAACKGCHDKYREAEKR